MEEDLFTEDLVGALRLVGGLSEDEVQQHVDNILNAKQEQAGMVATFCHVSDGECPTNVFTVGPGGESAVVQPSTWERIMEGWLPEGSERAVGLG